jgi:hypothetical protein
LFPKFAYTLFCATESQANHQPQIADLSRR